MTYTLKLSEHEDSYQGGGYAEKISIELKNGTSPDQAHGLAKRLKELSASKIKITLENSEEITEIK